MIISYLLTDFEFVNALKQTFVVVFAMCGSIVCMHSALAMENERMGCHAAIFFCGLIIVLLFVCFNHWKCWCKL